MTKHFIQITTYILFTIQLLFTSCNGQVKTELQQANKDVQKNGLTEQTKITKPKGMNREAVIVIGIQDKEGSIWLGSNGDGIYRFNGKSFVQFTTNDGLNSNNIYSVIEDKTGAIWIGTNKGLNKFDGEKFVDIPIVINNNYSLFLNQSQNNISPQENKVWSMMVDKKGTIWLGTDDGIYCYNGKKFTRFLDNQDLINQDSLKLKAIFSILEQKNGNIVFTACQSEGISSFDGKTLRNIIPYKNVGRTDRVIEDKNKNLWFACVFKGVGRFDGKNFTQNVFNEKAINGPSNIVEDRKGNIWFDTQEGLGCYDGKVLKVLTETDGISDKNLVPILMDISGDLWFSGKEMKLYKYKEGKFTSFSK